MRDPRLRALLIGGSRSKDKTKGAQYNTAIKHRGADDEEFDGRSVAALPIRV